MSETAKPHSTSDMLCPFFRRSMRKMCHRCEFWEPLPVQKFEMGKPVGSGFVEWGCTIKHQTMTLRSVLSTLDGVQQATESFRNTTWNDSQKNLESLIQIVSSAEKAIARTALLNDPPNGKLIDWKSS